MGHYIDTISLSSSDTISLMSEFSELPFNQQTRDVEDKMDRISRTFQQFDKLYQARDLAFEQASKLIRQKVNKTVQSLKQQEEKLLNELWAQHQRDSTAMKDAHATMAEKIQQLQGKIAEIQQNRDISELNLESSTQFSTGSMRAASLLPEICDELEDLGRELPQVMWPHRTIVRFVADETKPNVGYLQKCFMSDDFNRVTKYRICSFRAISVEEKPKVNLRRAKSELILNRKKKRKAPSVPKPHPSLLFRVGDCGSQAGCLKQPMGVSFLPSGNVLVADHDNQRLQEFNLQGTSQRFFIYGEYKPRSIAMTKDNYVATLDDLEHDIKVFTRGGQPVSKFGTGYFKEPLTLACNSKDQYILLDSYGPWQQYVTIYDPLTGVTKRIGYDQDGNYVLHYPEHIAIDSQDNILISDCGNHCIWIFTMEGKLLRRIGHQGDGDGQLSCPKGVEVDRRGNILVADCANHRVTMFSKEGKFVKHLLNSVDGLRYPTWLSISSTGVIAVVQNSELLVFET